MKGYEVNVLGTFQCTYNGQPLKKIPTGKMKLLFVYLLLHMDRPIDRKEIAFLLWPESTDQQSQTNLRKLLHHLRKILPKSADYLELEDGQMMWKSANGCIVDAVEFMKLANERDSRVNLSKAVSMYRGQLLPGVHVDWVIQHREELFLKYADIIQVLVKMCERMREYKQAIDYAYKILSYDPLDEKIHQLLIRLHLLNGNQSAAIRQYDKLKSLYMEQLGIQPSRETTDLYCQFMNPNFYPSSLSKKQKTPFIGRYQEWESLQRFWKQLETKTSCFVLIEGEKGMGKTHFLEQFSNWVAVQGATVRMSKCYPSKKNIPYESIIHWLERVDLSGLAKTYVSELSRIVPSLLDCHPDVPQPETIDDPWKLRYFYQAIEKALGWQANSLVFMIDDLQWVDKETLSFLEYMMRPERKKPFLIVATLRTNVKERSNAIENFLSELGSYSQLENIELNALTETEMRELVEKLYFVHNEKDVRQIYAVSGGNPLYIQELFLNNGYREESESSDATLRELMIQRLSSLPLLYRNVIDSLSVLGAASSLPLLLQISSISENSFQESVDFLYQFRFLKQTEQGKVDFFHDTIREAALSMISPAKKTLLHAKIAGAMKMHEHNELFSAVEIAFQYEQAGTPAMAVPYYKKAAEKANELYQHDQAINYSTKLLKILPAKGSCKPLSWIAHAYRMKGNLKQAASYYRKFLQQCSGTVSVEDAAMVRVQLAVCIRLQGNYDEAFSMLDSAEHQLEWVNNRRGLIEVYRQKTIMYIHLGQFKQAQHYLELSRGNKTNQQDVCMYLGLKADFFYENGMYKEAMDYFKRQITLANRVDARIPLLNALFGMSLTYLETDQYTHAFESILECIRLSRSIHDQIGLGLAIGILGKIYLRAGWVQEAIPCLHYSLKQAQQSGDQRSTIIIMGLIGHALHILGKTKDGLIALKQAERMSENLHFPLFHGNSLYYLGIAHAENEEWEQAESCLNSALQMMKRDGRRDLLCKVQLLLLECELAKGEICVTEAIKQIQAWLSQYSHREDRVRMYFMLWRLSEAENVRKEAEQCIVEVFRSMPIPCYREFVTAIKRERGASMMKPPQPPEEVSTMLDPAELVEWMKEQKFG